MVTPVAHGDHHVGPCEHPVDHLAHRLRRIGHVDVRIDGIRGPGTGDAGPDGSALAAVRNIDDLDIRNGLPQRPVLFLAETMRRTVVDDDQVQALVRIPGAKLRIGAGQRRDEPRSRIVTRAYDVEPVARPRGTGFCRLVCRLVCRRQGFVVQKDVRDGEILAPQPPDAVETDGEERQRTQRVGYEYATVELSRE